MTARVYLMADFGKGPRAWAWWNGVGDNPLTPAHHAGISDRRGRTCQDARAWWLVEAESAEAARDIIAHLASEKNDAASIRATHDFAPGRIIDSGGES
jgi:hypothetical protein